MSDGTSEREPVVLKGRYELHSRIARGGMAEVFLAKDQILDRPVAVKILFPEFATDPAFVERFRREAQSAANLNHPNIVGVFDWDSHKGTYFIVMEYVNGRSLAEVLNAEGVLHPDRAADIATDIAGALYFAHRNGVIHRDIKPGNVLIAPSGQVKVTDFGIARAVGGSTTDDLTQTGAVMGTATYFSPEQAQGKAIDPRSDLYSLGVVLYEMVSGKPPFSGDSPVAIAYKHVQESPVSPRAINGDVPSTLEAVTLKLLAKNPANRYASAEDLRTDLRRFREGQPVVAEPVMAPPLAVTPGVAQNVGAVVPVDATTSMPQTAMVPAQPTEVAPQYTATAQYEPPRRSGIFLAVLVALLVTLAVLLYLFARSLGVGDANNDDIAQVDVPDVTLQTVDFARGTLEARGFLANIEERENVDIEAGLVFSQNPPAGTRVDEGSTIELLVSIGDSLQPVPNLVGLVEGQAIQVLSDNGFSFEVSREFNETVPRDQVISQDPGESVRAPKRSIVRLLVSSGPEAKPIPNVADLSATEATAILEAAGYIVVRVNQTSSEVAPEQVISTEPKIGTDLAPGETVTIFVSSGVPAVPVPDVVDKTREEARAILEAAKFNVVEQFEETDDDKLNRVLRTQPGPETRLAEFSDVTVVIGKQRQNQDTTTTTKASTTTTAAAPTTTEANGGGEGN